MDTQRLAWAAGIFDAEGSVSAHLPSNRARRRPTMMVSQGSRSGQGSCPEVPPLLTEFRSVFNLGTIVGPYRGYLYYWRSGDTRTIAGIGTLLWPWLGALKRGQLLGVARKVEALAALEWTAELWDSYLRRPGAETDSESHRLAWAGGFFTGEGSIGAYHKAPTSPTGKRPSCSVTQASLDGGPPGSLLRFRAAVDAGAIHGPYAPRGWSRYPQYRWETSGHVNVERVMRALWPWLDARRRSQCEDALGSEWRLSVAEDPALRSARTR